jgi:hypothetical protein
MSQLSIFVRPAVSIEQSATQNKGIRVETVQQAGPGYIERRKSKREVRKVYTVCMFLVGQLTVEGIHCKKRLSIFPFPAKMSPTKLARARNTLIIPGQVDF